MKIPSIQKAPGPLPSDVAAKLDSMLAGLTSDQSAWLCGFFAGLNAAAGAKGEGTVAPAATAFPSATILYGSQTGNAEKLAKKLREKAQSRGIPVQLTSMADYKPAGLKKETTLLILVSTHGEGEPPDTAVLFHQFLHSKRAPKLDAAMRYSVLGLGDTSYQHFCKTGADLDARLAELGATRLAPRTDCDVDFAATADAWMETVLAELAKNAPAATTSHAATAQPAAAGATHDRDRPYTATLLEKILLNGRGSAKETHHYEISLEGSGLSYEPGDALGVIPRNTPDVVSAFLAAARLSPDQRVATPAGEMTAREACERHFEINLLTRPVLKAYAEWTGHPALLDLLKDDRRDDLNRFLYGRQVVDLLVNHPPPAPDPARLFSLLRKMTPRLYSIASSPRAHADEAHILVGATRYRSHGLPRKGVCSCYLADAVEPGGTLDLFIEPNANFRLPADPARDVIMVGPGTGVAPFRAFVEERQETGAAGRNWLFFGDQHFATDFLYQTEWQQALKGGALHRLDLAFSRDQTAKVYVQDRMRERGRELWDWLENGAHFYVCGDASRMARDVEAELLRIAAGPGGKSPEAAAEWLADLRSQKRYLRDVY